MNRVFISLYLVIVASVIFLGWGADRLWQVYHPEPEVHPYETLFFRYLESSIDWENSHEIKPRLQEQVEHSIEIYSLEELADSALYRKLHAGQILNVDTEDGKRFTYKRMADTAFVVRVQMQRDEPKDNTVYIAILIAFYLAVAVVVYFWVWPLSRDLKKLQAYTQHVGKDEPDKISLSQGSAVYDLAQAFSLMAERINHLLASHKEMTYAVSHELRTPLARMKFALEMLENGADGAILKNNIDSLKQDVAEMDTLINELLTYASFEQKNQTLELKSGDMAALIKTLLENCHALQKGAKMDFECDDQLQGERVWCEWYLMERALLNLIQNAFKYANEKVTVTLSSDVSHYHITVCDDGPGIPEADSEKVFQAFVRLRNDDGVNKSGFGLGLAIVRRILRWHGGEVVLKSHDKPGAAFTVNWPKPNHIDSPH